MRRILFTIAAVLCAAGCSGPGNPEGAGSRLVAAWTGSDTGSIVAAARAEWCDSLGLLEVRAIHGDTGLALAVYPGGPARPDTYPVLRPSRADSAPPSAAVVLRWFAETAIKGFQSDSGTVVLERANGRVSGHFEASLRSIHDEMRLDVRGDFRDLPVSPPERGCVPRPPAEPGDPGVD